LKYIKIDKNYKEEIKELAVNSSQNGKNIYKTKKLVPTLSGSFRTWMNEVE